MINLVDAEIEELFKNRNTDIYSYELLKIPDRFIMITDNPGLILHDDYYCFSIKLKHDEFIMCWHAAMFLANNTLNQFVNTHIVFLIQKLDSNKYDWSEQQKPSHLRIVELKLLEQFLLSDLNKI